MNLIAKILINTLIKYNLLLIAASSNTNLSQAELDNIAYLNDFVLNGGDLSELIDNNAEYDNSNTSL